jgi:GxxExxY protein
VSREQSVDSPQRSREAERIEPASALNLVTGQVVDAAFTVHKALGPGLLESVYEKCLAYELDTRGLTVERQVVSPIRYRDLLVEAGLRMDMVVNRSVIVEVKSMDRLLPIHQSQLFTYLKLSELRVGLLINFNVTYIKDGIRRVVLTA